MRAGQKDAADCISILPGDEAYSVPLGPITTPGATFIPPRDFALSHMISPDRTIVGMIRLSFAGMGMYVPLNAGALRLVAEKALGIAQEIEAGAAKQAEAAIERAKGGKA